MEHCASSGRLVEGYSSTTSRSGPEFSIPRSPNGGGETRNLHATSNMNGNGRQSIRTLPMANARARMSKLEAAMSAVGEEDPICPRIVGSVQEGPRPDTDEASARPHRRDRTLFGARQETCRRLPSRRGEGERGSRCSRGQVTLRGGRYSSGGRSSEGSASGGGQFRTGVGAVAGFRVGVAGRGTSCARSSQGEHRKTPVRGRRTSLYPHPHWNWYQFGARLALLRKGAGEISPP